MAEMEKGFAVKRAVIMAAGIGKRMKPVTDKIPKPLVPIQGIRPIDSVIHGLHENGIREIYVVTGYLREQFCGLEKQYPGLRLIENPHYDTCNNISSLYAARDFLENAMILDGDQIIYNKSVLDPRFSQSGYNCVWTEDETDEWILNVENGNVTSCCKAGGKKGWQLYSISRWTKEDGRKLKRHLEEEFEEKKNWQIYWDEVALLLHPDAYSLGIWEMKQGDVAEVDSLDQLIAFDCSYQKFKGGGIHE